LALTLALASPALAQAAPKANFLGSYHWIMDKPWFGGWSGIEVSSDGSGMTALTDRGRLIRARLIRENGRITGVEPLKWWRLKSSRGAFLTRRIADSEGLAVADNGTIHVSFEGITRVARFAPPSSPATVLRRHAAFRTFSGNNSLEALAIDRRNRLFAIPERLGNGANIPVFIYENQRWTLAFTLPGGDGFLPVGADFGPDGRLYLLERGWSVFGFRTRLRRWDVTGDTPRGEQLLIRSRTGTHDNLEGIAVWRDPSGNIRLTMIADDNFLSVQQTQIVEYTLQE